jgi:hypothetical protein
MDNVITIIGINNKNISNDDEQGCSPGNIFPVIYINPDTKLNGGRNNINVHGELILQLNKKTRLAKSPIDPNNPAAIAPAILLKDIPIYIFNNIKKILIFYYCMP